MKRVILDKKPKSLIKEYGTRMTEVLVDVKTQYTDETKFKNSAFVKTGRKVPTGKYEAIKIVLSGNKGKSFVDFQNKFNQTVSNKISQRILSGFVWNGYKVWLSAENQQNYASWVAAAKANSSIFPLKAKFNIGSMDDVVYYEFTSLTELEDLYCNMVKYINDTVNEGRMIKDYVVNNAVLYQDSFKS